MDCSKPYHFHSVVGVVDASKKQLQIVTIGDTANSHFRDSRTRSERLGYALVFLMLCTRRCGNCQQDQENTSWVERASEGRSRPPAGCYRTYHSADDQRRLKLYKIKQGQVGSNFSENNISIT